MVIKKSKMKQTIIIAISFIIPSLLYSQDGRIDTLITIDESNMYYLKNNIDSLGIWTVDVIKRIQISPQRALEISDTLVEIKHKRYKNFHLEIRGNKSYQFLIDKENEEKYYIYSDVYANPKNGIKSYTQCLYSNVSYPRKAQKNNIEGLAIMKLYINKEGCFDKVEPQSTLGYGIEAVTKMAMKSCDCQFNPSERNGEPVNAIWIMPMKFTLN